MTSSFSASIRSAALRGSDFYLLADNAKSEDIIRDRHNMRIVVGEKIHPQNGYHAELLCYARNCPAPQKVFLKFDAEDASIPVTGEQKLLGRPRWFSASPWLCFSSDSLFCGREIAVPYMVSGGADPDVIPTQTGVWRIPLAQIDPEITRQKLAQQKELTESEARSHALAKATSQALLAKYDKNHNGVIDLDEREDALDDPTFIGSELDDIDANHNGWLDALELAWFDANQNQILDPKEQAGIGIAQHLLAQKLLGDYDERHRGWLNYSEYADVIKSAFPSNPMIRFDLQPDQVDLNHDGRIDLSELEHVLKHCTETDLLSHSPGPRHAMRPPGLSMPQSADPAEHLKSEVESYWQHADGNVIRPAPGIGLPPESVPAEMSNGMPRSAHE
jgi:Ca2+-binding EF-hand superfamily protein